MDRDTFKKLSMGHYCYINLQGTIDKDEMLKFSEGAVWAYDFTQREKITSARFMPEPIKDPFIYQQEKSLKWPT